MNRTINAIFLSVTFSIFATAAIAAPPANDDWTAAALISGSSGTINGTTIEATTQTCEPNHSFPDVGLVAPQRTVWFKWVAPALGSYTFSLLGTEQSSISAYMMIPKMCNGVVTTLPSRIAENDAFSIPGSTGQRSQITFAVSAGTIMYVAVDSYGQTPGHFLLDWKKTRYRYSAQLDTRNQGTDLVITRELANTEWWFARASLPNGGYQKYGTIAFGIPADKKLLGDFTGDGVTDFAAIRSENGNLIWWIVNRDGNLFKIVNFGLATDRPIVGDYDGDGRADYAVTRAEANGKKTWHFLHSSDGSYTSFQFGLVGDREMIGDYDGDGKTDVVVLRNGGPADDVTWYILRSSDGSVSSLKFGRPGDIPQSADLNLDGKADLVVFRRSDLLGGDTSGNWYWAITDAPAGTPTGVKKFGQEFDFPQIGDYDGDGRIDFAVFRNGTWWIDRSYFGVTALNFGSQFDHAGSDLNISNAFVTF